MMVATQQSWRAANQISDVPYRWYHELYRAWIDVDEDGVKSSPALAIENADAMLRTLAEIRNLTTTKPT
jgi:hypothetical protein